MYSFGDGLYYVGKMGKQPATDVQWLSQETINMTTTINNNNTKQQTKHMHSQRAQ
jgi:hypothetical protein